MNRSLMEDFIRAYQKETCLWNTKAKDYHNKVKRKVAYEKLLEKYQLVDIDATKDAVIKKINSFRASYRRERKKVEDSYRSGTDIYEPSLWYYPLFDFLKDQDIPISSSPNSNEYEVSLITYLWFNVHSNLIY